MNIPKKIWNAAEKRGLDYIATGGGFDFIWRGIGQGECRGSDTNGVDLVLALTEDLASSPDVLGEPCTVSIYVNDPEWQNGLFIDFADAKKAMDFMASAKNVWTIDSIGNGERPCKKTTTTFERISDNPPTLEELQAKVGGYIEIIQLSDRSQLCVDEDGLMKNLPVNAKASELAARLGRNPSRIVGNAVHLKGKGRIQ
tara:strand:+ start:862 stop:1458 length:597 start_codon:yes stop_codon:yes gene_type:complete